MTKLLRCYELFPGCQAEVRAETEDQIVREAAEHARTVHGIQQIDEGTVQKVRAAIRTER